MKRDYNDAYYSDARQNVIQRNHEAIHQLIMWESDEAFKRRDDNRMIPTEKEHNDCQKMIAESFSKKLGVLDKGMLPEDRKHFMRRIIKSIIKGEII